MVVCRQPSQQLVMLLEVELCVLSRPSLYFILSQRSRSLSPWVRRWLISSPGTAGHSVWPVTSSPAFSGPGAWVSTSVRSMLFSSSKEHLHSPSSDTKQKNCQTFFYFSPCCSCSWKLNKTKYPRFVMVAKADHTIGPGITYKVKETLKSTHWECCRGEKDVQHCIRGRDLGDSGALELNLYWLPGHRLLFSNTENLHGRSRAEL